MGKIKRARTKYHLASAREKPADSDWKSESGTSVSSWKTVGSKKKCNVSLDEDLFKNIKIDVNALSTLPKVEDDRRSFVSISKTIKRSIKDSQTPLKLSKDAKRKLRSEFFIQKVAAISKIISKGKKKKSKGKEEIPELLQTSLKDLPEGNMLFYKSEGKKSKAERPVSKKSKAILKTKDRKQAELQNIELFKKVMSDPAVAGNAMDSITDIVLDKVTKEQL